MKNKLGEYRYLKEHHSNGSVSYWYFIGLDDCSSEYTYDENGNKLTYKNSDGYSWGCREDSNEDTFKVSDEDLASKTVETDVECWTSTTTTNQPFTYN